MRKRMATLREDNRRLRNEIMQRNFKNDATKKQEDSLYYLLQEFMVENNNLRAANKELRAKAIKESKLRMKTPNLQSLPILPNNKELSKSLDRPPSELSHFSSRGTSKLSTRTTYSSVSTQTVPIGRKPRKPKISQIATNDTRKTFANMGYSDIYAKRKVLVAAPPSPEKSFVNLPEAKVSARENPTSIQTQYSYSKKKFAPSGLTLPEQQKKAKLKNPQRRKF